jgi:enoyl-CoA hydratase
MGRARRDATNVTFQTLHLERRGPVGWLFFDRPDRGNALDGVMRRELPAAWIELDSDPGVAVIVCAGRGTDFSTGLDVAELLDPISAAEFRHDVEFPDSVRYTSRLNGVRKPVIAAVHGRCIGGALMWVVDADFAIAASNATFVDPHTALGQVVGRANIAMAGGGPFGPAMRWALVGRLERLSASDALRIGLVTEVVDPSDDLQRSVQAVAEAIASNSPSAMAATKRAMWRARQLGLDHACRESARDISSMWEHPDHDEARDALADLRPAVFQPLGAANADDTI